VALARGLSDRALLEMLIAEVQALHVKVDRLSPVLRISRADHRLAQRLFPQLLESFGASGEFTAGDALEKRTIRAIFPRSVKSLGQFFGRVCGVPVAGVWIERARDHQHTAVWQVHVLGFSGIDRGLKAA
jgi:hypothetical protein